MNSGAQAEEQPQGAQPQFHVRSARELFASLESLEGVIRLAALRAVQEAPETALSFGSFQERDLIDVLLSQAEHVRGEVEWLSWIGTLAAFRDPRVLRLFTSLITTESHAELLFALANYLRAEHLDKSRIQLAAAMVQNDCVPRARALAWLFAGTRQLKAAEALRVGLLEPADGIALPSFPAAASEWLRELGGPFEREAQLELRRQGPSTLAGVVGYWDRLSESSKNWALQWAAEADPDLAVDGIRQVLTNKQDALVLQALETAAELKKWPSDFDSLIAVFAKHSDELVRRAAALACRSGLNWRVLFEEESSVLVQIVCVARVVEQEGRDAIPFALQQLTCTDWRLRAAAVEGLLSLGEWGVRAALMLLPGAEEPVRIGIGRLVADWADGELLDEFIYRCSLPISSHSENST